MLKIRSAMLLNIFRVVSVSNFVFDSRNSHSSARDHKKRGISRVKKINHHDVAENSIAINYHSLSIWGQHVPNAKYDTICEDQTDVKTLRRFLFSCFPKSFLQQPQILTHISFIKYTKFCEVIDWCQALNWWRFGRRVKTKEELSVTFLCVADIIQNEKSLLSSPTSATFVISRLIVSNEEFFFILRCFIIPQ